jgi:hypothetical protein
MGVETNKLDLEKIDILKDLEKERANLRDRRDNIEENQEKENNMLLPLEEMKYIEWRFDSSDEEGFHVVSRKKSRKRGRKPRGQNKEAAKGGKSLPIEETFTFEGGQLRASSKYNLRKGAAWNKIV